MTGLIRVWCPDCDEYQIDQPQFKVYRFGVLSPWSECESGLFDTLAEAKDWVRLQHKSRTTRYRIIQAWADMYIKDGDWYVQTPAGGDYERDFDEQRTKRRQAKAQ